MTSGGEKYMAIPAERKKRILDYIEENGSAQIKELAARFSVSEATVRRDLLELDGEGYVTRTHGGAIMLPDPGERTDVRQERLTENKAEKRAIGEYAASLVREGDTVFLDAGTTSYCVGKALAGRHNLTIVTYDLHIATELTFHNSCTMLVTGGVRRSSNNVLTGVMAENFLKAIRVERAFLAVDAVDVEDGPSNANFVESSIKRMVVERSMWVALIADHTKFGRRALAKICNMSDLDLVITGKQLKENQRRKLEENEIPYHLV